MHIIEYDSDSFSDDNEEIYTAEFVWPSKTKSLTCESLKLIHKNRQEDLRFTFDVAKCDKIFDELHKHDYIKLSHSIPPLEELKRRAYCKYHNSYSHVTNDCNIFRRQIQSAINEGRLSLNKMQVDKLPFLINTIDLKNTKVIVRPKQEESTKGENVIICEKRTINADDKIFSREVVMEKNPNGKHSLKITITGFGHGAKA